MALALAARLKVSAARRVGVYTTGEVATLCRVAPRTVSKWFDSGHLNGYRIPGSQDRRIPAKELVRFLKAHGMPLPPELLEGPTLLVGFKAPPDLGGKPCELAANAFEAGVFSANCLPAVVVVDVAPIGRLDAGALASAIGRLQPRPKLVAVWHEPVPGYDMTVKLESLPTVLEALRSGDKA